MTAVPDNITIEYGAWIEVTFPLDPESSVVRDPTVAVEDWAPAPEVSDFEVWCEFDNDWAHTWRPSPYAQWFCRRCGSTNHKQRETEEI